MADDPTPERPAPSRSYLSQKFGKLGFGALTIIGYSVAGEETVVQVPELGVCFDVGRAPQFALSSDLLCITHGHMDHLAGIGYFVSQRHFLGMKPATILLPADLARPVDDLLRCWQRIERQVSPYTLVPMEPGDFHEVRKDFGIRALRTHHGGSSLGFACISVREKLKPDYHDRSGPDLANMRRAGVEIQYRVEVPLVTYLGDTGPGPVFEHPDVVNAGILITECTFYDPEHRRKSREGRHLHVAQLAEILPSLRNGHVVILHVSRRTGLARAKRWLTKAFGPIPVNVHFLMDLKDASDAGDAGDPAPESPL